MKYKFFFVCRNCKLTWPIGKYFGCPNCKPVGDQLERCLSLCKVVVGHDGNTSEEVLSLLNKLDRQELLRLLEGSRMALSQADIHANHPRVHEWLTQANQFLTKAELLRHHARSRRVVRSAKRKSRGREM